MMEGMGVFAEAFGYTPNEYRAMTLADHQRLIKYLVDKERRAKFAQKAQEHFARRRR